MLKTLITSRFCRLILLLPVALVAACSTVSNSAVQPVQIEGEWQLVDWQIGGKKQPVTADTDVPTVTISEDGRLSGYTGVNRYSTAVEFVANQTLIVSPQVITTRRAGPPAAMQQERVWLRFLPAISGYALENGQLKLLAGDSDWALLKRP